MPRVMSSREWRDCRRGWGSVGVDAGDGEDGVGDAGGVESLGDVGAAFGEGGGVVGLDLREESIGGGLMCVGTGTRGDGAFGDDTVELGDVGEHGPELAAGRDGDFGVGVLAGGPDAADELVEREAGAIEGGEEGRLLD
jgi:hypothetical protein